MNRCFVTAAMIALLSGCVTAAPRAAQSAAPIVLAVAQKLRPFS